MALSDAFSWLVYALEAGARWAEPYFLLQNVNHPSIDLLQNQWICYSHSFHLCESLVSWNLPAADVASDSSLPSTGLCMPVLPSVRRCAYWHFFYLLINCIDFEQIISIHSYKAFT